MITARTCLAPILALLIAATGCMAGPTAAPGATPSAPAPTVRSSTQPPVTVPTEALPGEVARFWYVRPANNSVAVGPYAVARKRLVVRGACISESGSMTWKIFDNSNDDDEAEVEFIDEGRLPCDGEQHSADASVGKHREVGVLAITGVKVDDDAGESVGSSSPTNDCHDYSLSWVGSGTVRRRASRQCRECRQL